MVTRASLALGATTAVLALTGCGGGSSNSFTIKADESGQVAYLVFDTAIPHRALERVLVDAMQSSGADAFVTTTAPAGSLDCNWHGAFDLMGVPDIPFMALHRYDMSNVSVKAYGSGSYADSVCSDLQATSG